MYMSKYDKSNYTDEQLAFAALRQLTRMFIQSHLLENENKRAVFEGDLHTYLERGLSLKRYNPVPQMHIHRVMMHDDMVQYVRTFKGVQSLKVEGRWWFSTKLPFVSVP